MWNHPGTHLFGTIFIATQWVSECRGFRNGAGLDDGLEI